MHAAFQRRFYKAQKKQVRNCGGYVREFSGFCTEDKEIKKQQDFVGLSLHFQLPHVNSRVPWAVDVIPSLGGAL